MTEEAKHTPTAAELIAEIEAGLEGTTPGKWSAFYKPKYDEWHVSVPIAGSGMKLALASDGIQSENRKWDAPHIARCSPDNMRVIFAELTTLRTKLAEAKRALGNIAMLVAIPDNPRDHEVKDIARATLSQAQDPS